ncbi:hypothetical protein [Sinorhizobium fredii]|uniref:hypothetical protein n=1 Tax=Rhizobium fredii TaxID=380 RepID=UPI00055D12CA|nr:hypothetical protein [Sinorhizobium fredii]
MIKQFGFSEEEYARVRSWLLSAFNDRCTFNESELLENLRSNFWLLVTTEHAASVIEIVDNDGELYANVLLLGGQKGKALREIIPAHETLCEFLKVEGFTKVLGTPRKELYRVLKINGFKEEQEKLIKRLN